MRRPDNYLSIKNLNLARKNLEEIPVWLFECVSLEYLNLHGNLIDEIPAFSLPAKLKEIKLSNNKLKKLDVDSLPKSLEDVDLSHNQISDLSNIRFSEKLKQLDLSKNQLTEIPILPEGLENLFLSGNQLTEIPIIPSSLIFIDLSHNKISKITPLPNTLKGIEFRSNFITTIYEDSFPEGIITLVLDNNKISKIHKLPSTLSHLSLLGNRLKGRCNTYLQTQERIQECVVLNQPRELIKPEFKYRFQNACKNGDIESVNKFYTEMFGKSSENLDEMCSEINKEIDRYEAYSNEYDNKIKCCVNQDQEICKKIDLNDDGCVEFLKGNQCLSLISGKDFKDTVINELYIYTENGQRYCFEIESLIKMNFMNPYTRNRINLKADEAQKMLDRYLRWVNPEVEEYTDSIPALQATLNNKVSPNILPDLTNLRRDQILTVFDRIYPIEIIRSHISQEEIELIETERNPLEEFLRTMIRLTSIEDDFKETRASLIANYLTDIIMN